MNTYESLKKEILAILTNTEMCAEDMVAEIGELVGEAE
jgi:hypothetical protein